jgi:hypothetical protein
MSKIPPFLIVVCMAGKLSKKLEEVIKIDGNPCAGCQIQENKFVNMIRMQPVF